jgi:hypothetical protein
LLYCGETYLPSHPAAPAGFLSDTDGISDSAFATAVLLEIQRIGGDADTISAPQTGSTPYPCDSIISLHGFTACGSNADQCARNWRRMARWITHTTAPISETRHTASLLLAAPLIAGTSSFGSRS